MVYPHFVELHTEGGKPVMVQADHICKFHWLADREVTAMYLLDGTYWNFRETYEEVKTLLSESGCSITLRDPRIDETPLTMEELKEMIGQPVFDSHLRKWMLVENALENVRTIWFIDYMGEQVSFSEADLIKYPLYRIKVAE